VEDLVDLVVVAYVLQVVLEDIDHNLDQRVEVDNFGEDTVDDHNAELVEVHEVDKLEVVHLVLEGHTFVSLKDETVVVVHKHLEVVFVVVLQDLEVDQ
jgi:hypothetical protein